MRFCYADPPYPGQAHKYRNHSDYGGEVDHKELIDRLTVEYPDGWALSTASTTLKQVLSLCPNDVRIGSWVKPYAIYKPGVNPGYAWEPVIFRGGRKRGRYEVTVPDWHSANITLRRGLVGVKPESFCIWVFGLLGARPDDELIDLFPGSGAVGRAWEKFQRQTVLPTINTQYKQLEITQR